MRKKVSVAEKKLAAAERKLKQRVYIYKFRYIQLNKPFQTFTNSHTAQTVFMNQFQDERIDQLEVDKVELMQQMDRSLLRPDTRRLSVATPLAQQYPMLETLGYAIREKKSIHKILTLLPQITIWHWKNMQFKRV